MSEVIAVKLYISHVFYLSTYGAVKANLFIKMSFTFQSPELKSTARLHLAAAIRVNVSKVELKFNPKRIFKPLQNILL